MAKGSQKGPNLEKDAQASRPGLFWLTFWPRFYHPQNYQRSQLQNISGHWAWLLAQNFDAHLAGMVIRADLPHNDKFTLGP